MFVHVFAYSVANFCLIIEALYPIVFIISMAVGLKKSLYINNTLIDIKFGDNAIICIFIIYIINNLSTICLQLIFIFILKCRVVYCWSINSTFFSMVFFKSNSVSTSKLKLGNLIKIEKYWFWLGHYYLLMKCKF